LRDIEEEEEEEEEEQEEEEEEEEEGHHFRSGSCVQSLSFGKVWLS